MLSIDLVPGTIAATCALFVYDYLFVTFDQEVNLVWSAKWTVGKVIFLLNRYLPFVDMFLSLHLLTGYSSPRECLLGFKTVTWLIVVGVILAELILMMRTYALWERNRKVLIVLICLGLLTDVPAIIVTKFETDSYVYGPSFPDGCNMTVTPSPIIFIAFVLLMISETVIVVLTVTKVWKLMRDHRSRLLVRMYHDGLLFYIYLLCMSILNVIIPLAAPPEFSNWFATPQRILHSILGTRVLLHIREGNVEPDMLVTNTHANISFSTPLGGESAPYSDDTFGSTSIGMGAMGSLEGGSEREAGLSSDSGRGDGPSRRLDLEEGQGEDGGIEERLEQGRRRESAMSSALRSARSMEATTSKRVSSGKTVQIQLPPTTTMTTTTTMETMEEDERDTGHDRLRNEMEQEQEEWDPSSSAVPLGLSRSPV